MEDTKVTIFGDTDGTLEARAKRQILIGIDGKKNTIYGDSLNIENMRGGNDVLIGGANSFENFLNATNSSNGNPITLVFSEYSFRRFSIKGTNSGLVKNTSLHDCVFQNSNHLI